MGISELCKAMLQGAIRSTSWVVLAGCAWSTEQLKVELYKGSPPTTIRVVATTKKEKIPYKRSEYEI